ncbi:hypothetical protein Patl1_34361 [Pistacia atlantica]|uniref:Uncharacterized protein n=1 Tax=Pistacia atlantica TaxID=434234 RepID=A0ACC0ZSG0_9ROSI|nr:hypothetical protein Patl1_34361 [Pistacia atlantica]
MYVNASCSCVHGASGVCYDVPTDAVIHLFTLNSPACQDTSSEEEVDLNDFYIDPQAEDRELKGQLLRKYSGYLGNLKQEFTKKKKKEREIAKGSPPAVVRLVERTLQVALSIGITTFLPFYICLVP